MPNITSVRGLFAPVMHAVAFASNCGTDVVMFLCCMQSEMRAELNDWDLWGPLFICMSLAVMLSVKAKEEASLVFSVIFVVVWVGAAIVTVNGQLLGGETVRLLSVMHFLESFAMR